MRVGDIEFLFDHITLFQKFIYLSGWFHDWSGTDDIADISLKGALVSSETKSLHIPHAGVSGLGSNKGFEEHILLSHKITDLSANVVIATKSGKHFEFTLQQLCDDRRKRFANLPVEARFREILKERRSASLLDIGGRDRSRIDRSGDFEWLETTVLDILPGDNVDIVGDAHELSGIFPGRKFDAIVSMYVFEHLAMPWRVAVEMNRVMKDGAIGLIATHQSVGMHDMPWDFWRFSDTSWDFLLNERTGFRIIDRAMADEMFLLPFICNENMVDADRSAGFYLSCVLFEKIGEASVDWPVSIDEITESMYPAGQN